MIEMQFRQVTGPLNSASFGKGYREVRGQVLEEYGTVKPSSPGDLMTFSNPGIGSLPKPSEFANQPSSEVVVLLLSKEEN